MRQKWDSPVEDQDIRKDQLKWTLDLKGCVDRFAY